VAKEEDEKSWLDVLSIPQDALKKATSGDEDIWFGENYDSEGKQRMPHEMWALGQVAGDLIADPLNLVGGAAKLVTKGKTGVRLMLLRTPWVVSGTN